MVLLQNNKFKEVLTREGVKNTKNRNAILEILENAHAPLTAEEIFLLLKEKNASTCLSTVYRTFEMLVSKGLVIKSNIIDDGRARYELNHMEHKHHIICVGCHKMISIDECPFEEFEKQIKKKIDFDVTGHKFEIYGYCQDCKLLR
jgi:Fur family ferric uptake transcriptional regulator